MKLFFRIFSILFSFLFCLPNYCMSFDWDSILEKYKNDKKVGQLIFVKHIPDTTKAKVVLYVKSCDSGEWKEVLTCDGLVGKDGIGEGSRFKAETPRGEYDILFAFGVEGNPGTGLSYVEVGKDIYCCGAINGYYSKFYNRFINVKDGRCLNVDKHGNVGWYNDLSLKLATHDCTKEPGDEGERLIDYHTEYAYALMLGYNKEGNNKKAFAIFMHCFGLGGFTSGCISVSEKDMIVILRYLSFGAKICIYEMKSK